MTLVNLIIKNNRLPRAAIFLSGSGSNAEKLLLSLQQSRFQTWIPAVLVTDAPLKSRAKVLAEQFNIPYIALDIKEFYQTHGESKVTILTEKGQNIRALWTQELRRLLVPFNIDFGILAGFVPLCNITADYPCLNVHPGDLTIEKEGKRILVGLHTIPIEAAILQNRKVLRTSVILAQPYTGAGGEMDSGPIIGISPEVPIDFCNYEMSEIKDIAQKRVLKRPVGGYKDALEDLAKKNQDKLKENGDWIVFPFAVADFAAGKFALDEQQTLYYQQNQSWIPIKTIIYNKDGTLEIVPR